MDKKVAVVGAVAGAAALVGLAVYEFGKKPATPAAMVPGATPSSTSPKNVVALPTAAGASVNLHVGDTLTILVPTNPATEQMYAFVQPATLSAMPGWQQSAVGPQSTTFNDVAMMGYPFTATAAGSTTVILALFPTADGRTTNGAEIAGMRVSVTANVT